MLLSTGCQDSSSHRPRQSKHALMPSLFQPAQYRVDVSTFQMVSLQVFLEAVLAMASTPNKIMRLEPLPKRQSDFPLTIVAAQLHNNPLQYLSIPRTTV